VAPQQQNPADRFDNIVQETADRAAARQLSLPSDNEVAEIAQQTGLQDDEVRQRLISTAQFGNYKATNGSLDAEDLPDGYTEITVGETGGRIDAHQALVPVEVVIGKVAEEMEMERSLVMNQVVDRYGGGSLPDKYHASVSGERHFYLPNELAGNMQPQPNPNPPQPEQEGLPDPGAAPPPMEDPNADPNRPFSKVKESDFRALIEEEKQAALARRQRLAIS
jgi:hypothetical protein